MHKHTSRKCGRFKPRIGYRYRRSRKIEHAGTRRWITHADLAGCQVKNTARCTNGARRYRAVAVSLAGRLNVSDHGHRSSLVPAVENQLSRIHIQTRAEGVATGPTCSHAIANGATSTAQGHGFRAGRIGSPVQHVPANRGTAVECQNRHLGGCRLHRTALRGTNRNGTAVGATASSTHGQERIIDIATLTADHATTTDRRIAVDGDITTSRAIDAAAGRIISHTVTTAGYSGRSGPRGNLGPFQSTGHTVLDPRVFQDQNATGIHIHSTAQRVWSCGREVCGATMLIPVFNQHIFKVKALPARDRKSSTDKVGVNRTVRDHQRDAAGTELASIIHRKLVGIIIGCGVRRIHKSVCTTPEVNIECTQKWLGGVNLGVDIKVIIIHELAHRVRHTELAYG